MDLQEQGGMCNISPVYLTKEPFFCEISINMSSHLFFYLDLLQALQVHKAQTKIM